MAQKQQQLLKQYLNLTPTTYQQYQLLVTNFDNLDSKSLRTLMEYYRKQYQNIIIIFINKLNDKQYLLLVGSSKTLHNNKQYQSQIILQNILKVCVGRGGGTPLLAQGTININLDQAMVLTILNAVK